METYSEGCLLCGKSLIYFKHAKKLKCEFCGQITESNASCEDDHYICDSCHAQKGFEYIMNFALETESRNPVSIAMEMMKNKLINMHGPEHHYMSVATLLVAYKNAGGKIDLEESLNTASQRAKNVPGGICGLWGSCGAAIGAGIFISVVTGSTPLSGKEWSLSNLITSQCLEDISKNGGPRCCKRNIYLTLLRSVKFSKKYLNVEMEYPDNIKCFFFTKNNECRKENCIFYPLSLKIKVLDSNQHA